ncbi:MAG: hypothetical protein HY841_11300 [Bacteroidetes bacterium]|nr:hypothetical protein [Bacteroidota bacterium]
MAESNFATKLQALKDLRNACALMTKYSPKQELIQIKGMDKRISALDKLALEMNPLITLLKDQRDERELKVHGQIEDDAFEGIIRRSRQVALYVDGMGEPFESEAAQIRKLVEKMKPSKTRRKPTSPEDKTRSTSEQSFASITAHADEILSIIKAMDADYAPADETISLKNYDELTAKIKELTKNVSETEKKLKPKEKEREKLTNRKSDGIRKIVSETKKYVRGNYGSSSDEWNSIRLIKV